MSGVDRGAPAAQGLCTTGEAVIVLADDLIWGTRLAGHLRALGAVPLRVGSTAAFEQALAAGAARRAVVDLTSMSYDGLAAAARAHAGGLRVIAVGQHDDRAMRSAARAAGAERVFSYRHLFEKGRPALAAWLGVPVSAPASGAAWALDDRAEGPLR
jgi:hypothetical protein